MTKTAKRSRNKRQINNQVGSIGVPGLATVKPVDVERTKAQSKGYDAALYIKNDIKWTLITTSIVVGILVILYLVFR